MTTTGEPGFNVHSWIAAMITCVLVSGAWIRAIDRIDEDRRTVAEEVERVHALVPDPIGAARTIALAAVNNAAERRRKDHYCVAVLESILAALAAVTIARFAWRSVRRERRVDRVIMTGGGVEPRRRDT